MEPTLRKIAIVIGLGLLAVSMLWSQDGFNFEIAGASKYSDLATIIGWFLALAVTVIQFVFSTSYKDLNPSLKFFGILAYVYSIYTNYWGILSFQGWTEGQSATQIGPGILAFVMDGVPEPLIAWGLYESLHGDFIGNLMKVIGQSPQRPQQSQNFGNGGQQARQQEPPQESYAPRLQQTQQNREQRHAQMRQQPNVPPFLNKNQGQRR